MKDRERSLWIYVYIYIHKYIHIWHAARPTFTTVLTTTSWEFTLFILVLVEHPQISQSQCHRLVWDLVGHPPAHQQLQASGSRNWRLAPAFGPLEARQRQGNRRNRANRIEILNISEPFWLRHIFARHLCSFPVEASREGEVPNHATQLWKINSLHSDRLDSQLKATTARSPTVLKPNVLKHLEDATTFYQGVT